MLTKPRASEHALSTHAETRRRPKQPKDCHGKILQAWILREQRTITQEHTRYVVRIDAVISDPRIRVVFEQRRRCRSQCRLPGTAVGAAITDNHVRTRFGVSWRKYLHHLMAVHRVAKLS